MKSTEIQIQTAVCDYLEVKRKFFWRNNTIPPVQKFSDGSMKFRRMPKYTLNGLPDIFVLSDGGYLIGLEIKSESGVLSDSQKEIQKRFKDIGAEYYVIRSVDEVMKLFI